MNLDSIQFEALQEGYALEELGPKTLKYTAQHPTSPLYQYPCLQLYLSQLKE